MQRKNIYRPIFFKAIIAILIIGVWVTSSIHGQNPNPVEGYSVLQQVVSKTGGRARLVEEGNDGSYFMEYLALYNDTMSINSHDHQLVFNDPMDSIPIAYSKIVKYNKEGQVIAEKIVYSNHGSSTYGFERMRYDSGHLFLQFEVYLQKDKSRDFNVGDQKIVYGPTDDDSDIRGQIIVILDSETLHYKDEVLVQSDGTRGFESWNVKNGYLYFRQTPIRKMIVAQDTFTIDHGMYLEKWVNVVKYDYKAEEVVWSNVIASNLPLSGVFNFPTFLGLDIDDRGYAYISFGDMGPPYVLANDTIHPGDADIGHGAVVVLDEDGDIARSDIINGDAFVMDVKSIGGQSYIMIQGYTDFINYRGMVMGLENEDITVENFLIKTDLEGNYLDHYTTFSGCDKLYNYMRLNSDNNLQIYGEYVNYNNHCDNMTNEGDMLPYEKSGSIQTFDQDLNVLSNSLFSAMSVQSIPHDSHISSGGKLVNYITNNLDVYWPYFDEEPFFFEDSEDNRRSIVLAHDDLINSVADQRTDESLILYPNPTYNNFRISKTQQNESAVIEIYNSEGMLISEIADYNHAPIDISDQPPGIYLVKYISHNKIFTHKLIKI